jgi:protein ImuB
MMAGARVLIARLVVWARARQSRVAAFTLRLHHEPQRLRDALASELDIGLAAASADAEHLASLLAERLARMPLAGPALEMSLRCAALVQSAPPNAELFPTRSNEREGLTRLIERLQARLGADGVQRLVPVADHRPERAAAWVPAEAASPSFAASHAPTSASDGPVRPLWLLPDPVPLPELGSRPTLDGTPLQLLAGPERIESGWWDGGLAARDYFIARANDGALVWVFRARLPLSSAEGDGWFLQGRFA